jgi:hypothetical protein
MAMPSVSHKAWEEEYLKNRRQEAYLIPSPPSYCRLRWQRSRLPRMRWLTGFGWFFQLAAQLSIALNKDYAFLDLGIR